MASRVGDKAVAPSTASVTGLQQTSVSPLVIQAHARLHFQQMTNKSFEVRWLFVSLKQTSP
ncbi:hypothetical protein HanRHA438_Chr09g0412051 [Helianthus annuus]|nr:hypothetical protein HanRHA438_Chr09g0412051 [Helianthus annuus]